MDYRQIVWLSSYPKSGNTWLRCFLDAYLLGEVDINSIISSMIDDKALLHNIGTDDSKPNEYPVQIQVLTRPMALLRLVRRYNSMAAPIPLFVKTHNAHTVANGIELLPQMLTKAVIHIVRDPRDVLVSFSKHVGKSIEETLGYFLDPIRVLSDARSPRMHDFLSSWPKHEMFYSNHEAAASHNVKIFRYEDMKAYPVQAFSQILQHAGIHPDKERVQKALDTVKLENLRKQEQEKGFGESSPYNKDKFFGTGKSTWRDVLTPQQIHRIEKACSTTMKRYKYEFSMKKVA